MTELEALNISIELWEWLVNNFPAKKVDYPKYKEIHNFRFWCSLCSLFYDGQNMLQCPGCCLDGCGKANNFESWWDYTENYNGSETDALQAARNILETMKIRKEEIL